MKKSPLVLGLFALLLALASILTSPTVSAQEVRATAFFDRFFINEGPALINLPPFTLTLSSESGELDGFTFFVPFGTDIIFHPADQLTIHRRSGTVTTVENTVFSYSADQRQLTFSLASPLQSGEVLSVQGLQIRNYGRINRRSSFELDLTGDKVADMQVDPAVREKEGVSFRRGTLKPLPPTQPKVAKESDGSIQLEWVPSPDLFLRHQTLSIYSIATEGAARQLISTQNFSLSTAMYLDTTPQSFSEAPFALEYELSASGNEQSDALVITVPLANDAVTEPSPAPETTPPAGSADTTFSHLQSSESAVRAAYNTFTPEAERAVIFDGNSALSLESFYALLEVGELADQLNSRSKRILTRLKRNAASAQKLNEPLSQGDMVVLLGAISRSERVPLSVSVKRPRKIGPKTRADRLFLSNLHQLQRRGLLPITADTDREAEKRQEAVYLELHRLLIQLEDL